MLLKINMGTMKITGNKKAHQSGSGRVICVFKLTREPCDGQERDRLTMAAESRTRIKLKQQELRGKDAQIASLISTRRGKLEGLLACNAGGMSM